jgi:Kdo2-lipid IVA lauroyltransferase/acyltransferase
VEYEHPELISMHLKNGQSVIMTGSHHCNWEWAAITVAGSVKGEVVGVYKRLTNKYIERYVKVQRAGMGMTLLEMKSTMQSLSEHTAQPAAYVLMADQWPSNPKRAHWAEFMGRETACLPGVDFISRQYGFPVIYYEMTRLRRGFYRISFSELVALERVQEFAEGEITTLNQKRITEQVKTDPANWLWSHKRWKRTRQNVEAEMQNGHSGLS